MKLKRPRIRWRKQPNEEGIARVSQGPRGAILRVENHPNVARVYAVRREFGHYRGWYWVAVCRELGVPLRNTADEPCETLEQAKEAAEAYVRECLAKVEEGKG